MFAAEHQSVQLGLLGGDLADQLQDGRVGLVPELGVPAGDPGAGRLGHESLCDHGVVWCGRW